MGTPTMSKASSSKSKDSSSSSQAKSDGLSDRRVIYECESEMIAREVVAKIKA